MSAGGVRSPRVSAQYWELHNEVIGDLLHPENQGLKIVDDADNGAVIRGLTTREVRCHSGGAVEWSLKGSQPVRCVVIRGLAKWSSHERTHPT